MTGHDPDRELSESDQMEWARRFKQRMLELGTRVCVEKLTDMGLKLWTIYGAMQPEDVAEFEFRVLTKR
jgi:hypothetical protein